MDHDEAGLGIIDVAPWAHMAGRSDFDTFGGVDGVARLGVVSGGG